MKRKRTDGLNLVPFIDVMLVLLALVLSISTFLSQGQIHITPPQANAPKNQTQEQMIQISINTNNQYIFKDKILSLQEVKDLIQSTPKQTHIQLLADEKSHFQSFVSILEILTQNQNENFSILTQTR